MDQGFRASAARASVAMPAAKLAGDRLIPLGDRRLQCLAIHGLGRRRSSTLMLSTLTAPSTRWRVLAPFLWCAKLRPGVGNER